MRIDDMGYQLGDTLPTFLTWLDLALVQPFILWVEAVGEVNQWEVILPCNIENLGVYCFHDMVHFVHWSSWKRQLRQGLINFVICLLG